MLRLDVRIVGKGKEEDDINDAILAGKRMVNGDVFSTDDTGNGIVGNDTAGEQLPICILGLSFMLRGYIFGFSLTGEISSPDGCNGNSGIEMLLRGVDFDVKIEGVICNDLLLASDTPE